MVSSLLGTTVSLSFTAKELDAEIPAVAEQRSRVEQEGQLVADLVARCKTCREQTAEWIRLTGKSRKTLLRRLSAMGLLKTSAMPVGAQ
jgi:hypothetical protein